MKSSQLRARFLRILWFFAGIIARFIFGELLPAQFDRGAQYAARAQNTFAGRPNVFAPSPPTWAEFGKVSLLRA